MNWLGMKIKIEVAMSLQMWVKSWIDSHQSALERPAYPLRL